MADETYTPNHTLIPQDLEHAYTRCMDFAVRNVMTFSLMSTAGNALYWQLVSQQAFRNNDLRLSAQAAQEMERYDAMLDNPDIYTSVIAADA